MTFSRMQKLDCCHHVPTGSGLIEPCTECGDCEKPRILDLFCGAGGAADWMNGDEISEAIPPAYSEYIGRHLMKALR